MDIVAKFTHNMEELLKHKKKYKILVCVSGGKDSTVLLDLLYYFSYNQEIELSVFHLNHKQRGDESDEDENFVIQLANKYKLDLYNLSHTFDNNSNFEEEARKIRYNMIYEILKNNTIDYAATAHTLDDSVETTLMRLFSGTSLLGARGIDLKFGNIIRPLITCSGNDVLEYCKVKKIEYREDSSNTNNKFDRNYVRNNVIPIIKERYELVNAIVNFQKHVKSTQYFALQYILNKVELYSDGVEKTYRFPKTKLEIDEKKFVIAEILRNDLRCMLSYSYISDCVKKVDSEKTRLLITSNEGLHLFKFQNKDSITLLVTNVDYSEWVKWNQQSLVSPDTNKKYIENSFFRISYRLCDTINEACENEFTLSIEEEEINYISIRQKSDGDKIATRNMTKKIKKIFIDEKLTHFQKSIASIIEVNSQVAALCIPKSSVLTIVADNFNDQLKTKKILAIGYTQK
jgi:tRNA(Ile)-lysidine synthase